jgi:hypothetical protein
VHYKAHDKGPAHPVAVTNAYPSNVGNWLSTTLRVSPKIDWATFTNLPSRKSAQPVDRAERDRLMARVSKYGFIDDYQGNG